MIVVILNLSKKKSFRTSKRIISEVLQPITNRLNIGDIPKRVLVVLLKNLKTNVTKGTSIQIFIESKNIGFRGFKGVQIGVKKVLNEDFFEAKSLIDMDLVKFKIIPRSP